MLNRSLIAAALVLSFIACTKTETNTNTSTPAPEPAQTTTTATTASSTASSAPTPRDVCAMLTAEELKSLAGIDKPGTKSTSGGADVCTWYGAGGGVIAQVYPYKSSYEGSRSAFEGLYGTKAADLPGVGEKAFYIEGKTGPIATATISAMKGSTPISVQVMGSADAATRKKQASDVANALLAKL